jgi:hypothetical protein
MVKGWKLRNERDNDSVIVRRLFFRWSGARFFGRDYMNSKREVQDIFNFL